MADPSGENRQLVGGGSGEAESEPIYGPQYMPRKFKTAIGFPDDNCIDIYTHDLGFLALVRDDQIIGYNVLVGGGMGVTPSAKKTFPALAKRLAFVTPDRALDVATAVIKVQRDFGNRSDRKVARLKYLIHDWGLDAFKAKVEEYFGGRLPEPEPDDVRGFNDHLGWEPQGDGRWFYGLNVENGRIKDDETIQLKSALREICRTYKPGVRLTSHQSLIFTDLAEGDKAGLEEHPAAAPRAAERGDFHGSPLVDGVRRLADVRFVDHGIGTRPCRASSTGWSRSWPAWGWPARSSRCA